MRILQNKDQLTNFEVLRDVHAAKSTTRSENLQTIVVELQAYLRERPAGNPSMPQTEENLKQFVQEMSQFKLESSELLQIINSAPDSMPVLYCLVEEPDLRFTEEQLEEMIEITQKYLGEEVVPGEPEAES